MTITDLSLLIILFLLAARGAHKGFLRTLIGPASFLIATGGAMVWFNATHRMPSTLVIALLGPLLLGWFLHQILQITLWKNGFPPVNTLSAICGAIIQIIWGGSMFVILIVLAVILPLKNFGLSDITHDVQASTTYRLLQKPLEDLNLIPRPTLETSPEQDAQTLLNEPKIQKILSDTTLQEAIKNKDYATLMSSPLILELAQDPSLVAKMFKAYPKLKANND